MDDMGSNLRINPETGQAAERIPDYAQPPDGHTWLTWHWQPDVGLTVQRLTDDDVADWRPCQCLAPNPADPVG
jgi:hypothetical protein